MKQHKILHLIICVMLIVSCDTKDTVDPTYNEFFIKYYGNEGDQKGQAIVTTETGIYLAGTTLRAGGLSEIFLVKTNLLGTVEWERSFDYTNDLETVGMVMDDMGNLYIAANRRHDEVYNDFYVMKTDAGGNFLSDAYFSADDSQLPYDDHLESITITGGNDLILTGWTSNVIDKDLPSNISDVYTLRLNSDLVALSDIEWRKRSGFRESMDLGKKIIQARPGGQYFFIGTTDKADGTGITAQTNLISFPLQGDGQFPSGDVINGTTFTEEASDIIPTSAGDVVAMWNSSTGFNASTIYLAYANEAEGYELQTGRSLPLSATMGNSIIQSRFGGFIILGEQINNNNTDIFLIRTNQNFDIEWQTVLGGLENETATQVAELSDGSIVLTGSVLLESQQKMFLIKTKANGQLRP